MTATAKQIAAIIVAAASLVAPAAKAAGAQGGNTSSGNVSTNTSSNTSRQATSYSSVSPWAEDIYAGRIQGPAARAFMFVHPPPAADRR